MTRPLWITAGGLCFVLGWVGMVLPLMPGFVFFLAALFCFARGHPPLAGWMLDHPRLGPPLRDWGERRAIGRPAKRSAVIAIALAAVLAVWLVGMPWALLSVGILASVAAWIWTRAE